jgi:hypothetical protein
MIPAITPRQVMDHYAYMVTVNRIISRMNSWLKDQPDFVHGRVGLSLEPEDTREERVRTLVTEAFEKAGWIVKWKLWQNKNSYTLEVFPTEPDSSF